MIEAHIAHMSPGRVRIRIPSKRKDRQFFAFLRDMLANIDGIDRIEVNPATASVLIRHHKDNSELIEFAAKSRIFSLKNNSSPPSVKKAVTEGFGSLNKQIQDITGGGMDLWTVAFITLVGTGIYQISRGNFAAPAWYTAFWYAFNTLLKAPSDEKGNNLSEGAG